MKCASGRFTNSESMVSRPVQSVANCCAPAVGWVGGHPNAAKQWDSWALGEHNRKKEGCMLRAGDWSQAVGGRLLRAGVLAQVRGH